ncbi:GntR family transcriptional regulator [Afipia felis]|nr:GntR family transcriptional regulator [Afipia felis]
MSFGLDSAKKAGIPMPLVSRDSDVHMQKAIVSAPLSGVEPLYKQVKNKIIQNLTSDEWKPGSVIPSETRLAETYGVGVSTIRMAIGELVAARILIRRQGKGTFVSSRADQHSVYQFFHVVKDGADREAPVSELLSFKRGQADDKVADILNLPRSSKDSEVFKLRNLLRISGSPVALYDIVIPCALFKGLSENVIRNFGRTLYGVYQSRYGITIVSTTEELRAVKADSTVARSLKIQTGDPVIEVTRVASTFDSKPVEVRRGWVNTKGFHYFITQGGE